MPGRVVGVRGMICSAIHYTEYTGRTHRSSAATALIATMPSHWAIMPYTCTREGNHRALWGQDTPATGNASHRAPNSTVRTRGSPPRGRNNSERIPQPATGNCRQVRHCPAGSTPPRFSPLRWLYAAAVDGRRAIIATKAEAMSSSARLSTRLGELPWLDRLVSPRCRSTDLSPW